MSWVDVPTYFEGLTVEVDITDDLKAVEGRGVTIGTRHLYTLSGVGYRGFVVAHLMKQAEDDADFAAPSSVYVC